MTWKTKGMNQDISVSAFNPEFSFENMNLRLSTNEGNTQMSWVNERGTQQIILLDSDGNDAVVEGITIGTALINHCLVLFTTGASSSTPDHIYLLTTDTSGAFILTELYAGNLDFDIVYPLETLVSYESDLSQKVYWTDGHNQLRLLNIAGHIRPYSGEGVDFQFDFIPELQLNEKVHVAKLFGSGGMFAPGTIQYCFTYYNLYGQESNIFHTTPLYYISYRDRGGSPEDKIDNVFKISVELLDPHFDYLRIYSIQRTSINAVPIVKRVQDILLKDSSGEPLSTVTFLDDGMKGDSIDPSELLYKGGESLVCKTLEQKDDTLFMGNLTFDRPNLLDVKDTIKSGFEIHPSSRTIYPEQIHSGSYVYYNQLTSYDSTYKTDLTPCGGFKKGDKYRLGIQFQHKSGKWSEPVKIADMANNSTTVQDNGSSVTLASFTGESSVGLSTTLHDLGYRKARAVVVFPEMQDRKTICQGVVNPTLYTDQGKTDSGGNYKLQSSWFFRCPGGTVDAETKTVAPYFNASINDFLCYKENTINDSPDSIRRVEIQGVFNDSHKFKISSQYLTFHSPDVEFDSQLQTLDFTGMQYQKIGGATITNTLSDIDIQTETPTVSNEGTGFIHKSFSMNGPYGIVSGLFYDDFIVDDKIGDDSHIGAYPFEGASAKFMVYPWQKNGSLNNDINRPSDKGTATALLKKKVISNLRYATTQFGSADTARQPSTVPQLFSSNEVSIEKLGNNLYQGNVDTLLMPDEADGVYFTFKGDARTKTGFTEDVLYKTYSQNVNTPETNGIYKWENNQWVWNYGGRGDDIGDEFVDLAIKKEGVRMKYKSTPHIILDYGESLFGNTNELPIVEIQHRDYDSKEVFGGNSIDALRCNIWIPCGNAVPIRKGSKITVEYLWGDTYFQRWDCLKTYPFSPEDPNQVVEIGSFMLETHVNIDGRYDRNRGQQNNLNMSPKNFNLLNPVYSQRDNFFTYRIMPEDYYRQNTFSNQITWSKTKQPGSDVDMWTNVTLANILELDGNKGEITSLQRYNNQLICFQDTGISQILYNENTQISTTEGVPVEIANSGKVQGKRYLSDTIGCSNKWSISITPSGLYFIDSIGKSIYMFNGQLANLSTSLGFNSWCKTHIEASASSWNPVDFGDFRTVYDRQNQELLFINKEYALGYSEKSGVFTSFYSYEASPWLMELEDKELWIRNVIVEDADKHSQLWLHQYGDYNKFFGKNKPYWMTLICNAEPQTDKVFTNLEFRACVEGEGSNTGGSTSGGIFDATFDSTFNASSGSGKSVYTPYIPIDSVETWDEYQHGISLLSIRDGHLPYKHHFANDANAHLSRKFRIWRCDVPRNNCLLDTERVPDTTYDYSTDASLHVSRFSRKPMDRMRNPWLYIKLKKGAVSSDKSLHKTELHDILMTYFN